MNIKHIASLTHALAETGHLNESSSDLFEKITQAVERNNPLTATMFFQELVEQEQIDLDSLSEFSHPTHTPGYAGPGPVTGGGSPPLLPHWTGGKRKPPPGLRPPGPGGLVSNPPGWTSPAYGGLGTNPPGWTSPAHGGLVSNPPGRTSPALGGLRTNSPGYAQWASDDHVDTFFEQVTHAAPPAPDPTPEPEVDVAPVTPPPSGETGGMVKLGSGAGFRTVVVKFPNSGLALNAQWREGGDGGTFGGTTTWRSQRGGGGSTEWEGKIPGSAPTWKAGGRYYWKP